MCGVGWGNGKNDVYASVTKHVHSVATVHSKVWGEGWGGLTQSKVDSIQFSGLLRVSCLALGSLQASPDDNDHDNTRFVGRYLKESTFPRKAWGGAGCGEEGDRSITIHSVSPGDRMIKNCTLYTLFYTLYLPLASLSSLSSNLCLLSLSSPVHPTFFFFSSILSSLSRSYPLSLFLSFSPIPSIFC